MTLMMLRSLLKDRPLTQNWPFSSHDANDATVPFKGQAIDTDEAGRGPVVLQVKESSYRESDFGEPEVPLGLCRSSSSTSP